MTATDEGASPFDVSRFVADLGRQRAKYQELNDLMDEQDALIGSRNLDALLNLMERKRAILDEVERIDQTISPVKARWEEWRDRISPEERGSIQAALVEVGETLKTLVAREEGARRIVEERRDGNSEELRKLWKMKHVRNAYRGGGGSEPRFMDRNDENRHS